MNKFTNTILHVYMAVTHCHLLSFFIVNFKGMFDNMIKLINVHMYDFNFLIS